MTHCLILLTRFNCRFDAPWTSVALQTDWLSARFELFERYCLPSVLQQTQPAFTWIIFFDRATPEPFKSRAYALASDNIRPVFVDYLTGDLVRSTIRDHIPTHCSHVITSRLDNDDGLAIDYVERVLSAYRPADTPEYLNITKGVILHRGRIYQRRDAHNAFVSLAEPVEGTIQGVWARVHTEIHHHAPVRQISGGPGWLQVVHGANISNKVRGKRIHPDALDPRLVLNRNELIDSHGLGYVLERHIMSRYWAIRDSAAAALRTGRRFARQTMKRRR